MQVPDTRVLTIDAHATVRIDANTDVRDMRVLSDDMLYHRVKTHAGLPQQSLY